MKMVSKQFAEHIFFLLETSDLYHGEVDKLEILK
jgi:hypothetical protein